MTEKKALRCVSTLIAWAALAGCSNGSSGGIVSTTGDNPVAECELEGQGPGRDADVGNCVLGCGGCSSFEVGGACDKCECVKTCADVQCGPDGCGGECGVGGQGEAIRCGDVECPPFPGAGIWKVYCNEKEHCEYSCVCGCQPGVEIFVPPGTFPMGSTEDDSECAQLGFPDACAYEHPIHDVTFSLGYFIDKYEVTNSQYAACVAAGACSRPNSGPWKKVLATMVDIADYDQAYENFPVVGVSWAQAVEYCAWLGKKLPSEAQWERAATGVSHHLFPWGDSEPTPDMAVYCYEFTLLDDCIGFSVQPVGTKPKGASPVGAMDMAGNVAEFVEDCFHRSYEGAPVDGGAYITGCEQPPAPYPEPEDWVYRVRRGGSAGVPAVGIRTSRRVPMQEKTYSDWVGFRCARDADKP